MDILQKVVATFFPDLLRAVTVKAAASAREYCPGINISEERELSATVDKLTGNSGPQQLMAIERFVGRALQQHRDAVMKEDTKFRLETYFGGIEETLTDAETKYKRFVDDKCPSTWKPFCQAVDFEKDISGLFRKIKKSSLSRKEILRDFDAICDRDLSKYKTWQRAVCLTFSRAYLLRTAFLYYATFSDKSYDDSGSGKGQEQLWSAVLPKHAEEELLTMEHQTQEIVKVRRTCVKKPFCSTQ